MCSQDNALAYETNLAGNLLTVYWCLGKVFITVFWLAGNKYWAAQGEQMLPGYPKDIYSSFGFPRSVKNIDAAVFEEDTGKTYFFVANKIWR